MARRLDIQKTLGDSGQSYGELLVTVLKFAPPQRGVTLDQVIAAVDAMRPIDAALAAGQPDVVLEDGAWRLLCDKLNSFPFAFADPAIAEFGLAIRNAPEIGLDRPAGGQQAA